MKHSNRFYGEGEWTNISRLALLVMKGNRIILALSSAFVALVCIIGTPISLAQSLDLTVDNFGLSIGDSRRVNGVRLNFRDRNLEQVNGLNLTLWEPIEPVQGDVRGLAIGLPTTGAREISGLGVGLFGVSARESIRGVVVGGLGAGSGEDLVGISVAGLGVGGGRDIRGVMIGGLGAGSGRDVVGFGFGGLGVGGGRNVRGLMIGGLGAGAGGDLDGLGVGGMGVGAGGSVTGIVVGGIGVGAGENLTGLAIGGIGVGAGGTLRGVGISGVGVGAPTVRGLLLSGVAAGGEDVVGASVALAYFRIGEEGRFKGVSASAFNYIKGEQHGLTIGLLNIAGRLNGIQIGLVNYARNNPPGLRLLPLVNAHFD